MPSTLGGLLSNASHESADGGLPAFRAYSKVVLDCGETLPAPLACSRGRRRNIVGVVSFLVAGVLCSQHPKSCRPDLQQRNNDILSLKD